ncbi:MAG: acyltransferase [Chitinophagaceae bacterium]|nr:acyltransferase [Chitinophagaceae bacterium]
METNSAVERLHYFDGLRAVACLLILFHHTVTANMVEVLTAHHMKGLGDIIFNFTQSGVELFFVLSGIVLMKPYFTGVKTFNVWKYANRRFWRIYTPFFFAVWFAGFVIWINTFYPTWYSTILIDFTPESFARQFLLFNWKGDYYNLAWWSLQIEIVFYVCVPLILYMGKSWKLFPATVITFILSLLLQRLVLIYFPDQYSIDYIVLGPLRLVDYLLCFLFGVLLAKEDFNLRIAILFIIVGLILLVGAFWYMPFHHMSLAFLYFGALIIVIQSQALKSMLSSHIMVWIGERSYSLFLTHFSVLYLTNYMISYFIMERSLVYGIYSRVLGILLSFFTAMILFYFVERKQAHGLQTAHQFWPSLKA